MEVPEGYLRIGDGSDYRVVRTDLAAIAAEVWWGDGVPLPSARGRGAVRVLAYAPGARAVARAYRRGGALRSLRARFLAPGRAPRELGVLVELRRRGVAAVEPLAALCRRRGLFWELRLVTALVPEALPLPAFLARRRERAAAAVRAAGRVVRAAFDAGLRHPDLHPDNLLVSCGDGAPSVWLLDLDRASIGAPVPQRERDRMLLRMARYLERHAGGLPVASRAVDHVRFLDGMGLDRGARRAEMHRLLPRYARSVVRHRVSWTKPA